MADEYISREAAIDKHCAICKDNALCYRSRESCPEVKSFNSMPAADVQPVRHGRWIETTQPMGWEDVTCAECSECGEDFVLDEWGMEDMKNLMHYCPNCGADMNEVDE